MLAHLEDRAVIAIAGSEARSFLQGLITNDLEKLAPGCALYAALLTPQGKILFDFFLTEGEGAILLDCARSSRDALVKRLSMYRLRAKATIERRDQLEVLFSPEGAQVPHAVTFKDPRLDELGSRSIGATAEMRGDLAPAAAYHAHRLSLGVPESTDFGSDQMFALDADLDELNAISFEKGCYVGQELTARMKHRATSRKRLLPVETRSGSAPLASNTSVTAGGREIGVIVSSYRTRGFALLRLDRLEEAAASDIRAGEIALRVLKPHWLFA